MTWRQRLGSSHTVEKSPWTILPILSPIGPTDQRAASSLDPSHPCCPPPSGTFTPFWVLPPPPPRSSSPQSSNSESSDEYMDLFIFNNAIVSIYAFDAFSECLFDAKVFSCIIELNPPHDPGRRHDPHFTDEPREGNRLTQGFTARKQQSLDSEPELAYSSGWVLTLRLSASHPRGRADCRVCISKTVRA